MDKRLAVNPNAGLSNESEGQKAAKIKVRYAETKMVKEMRERFEKAEKVALRSSRTYRELNKIKKEKNKEIDHLTKGGGGECYVDSSRGIATSMGVSDVKDTMIDYEDQLALVGKLSGTELLNLHILIEQAAYELRQHKPETALGYIKSGLRKDRTSIELLELKGKCLIDMNKYREAIDAADEILIAQRETTNSTALAVKASALYNMGDFEHALMSFHRALRTSSIRDRLMLLEGIKSAELGVMNAVGSNDVQYFRDLDSMIELMPINIMGMSWHELKTGMNDSETKKMKKKKDRKFLEALASDKQYLEGIIKKINKTSPKTKTTSLEVKKHLVTQSIVSEAEGALGFLRDRREFWSQQKPDYPTGPEESISRKPKWNAVQNRLLQKKPEVFNI